MADFEMTLASKKYVLSQPVVREPIADYAEPIREGAPGYGDKQGVSAWEWNDLSGGIGLEIMDTRNPDHKNRYYTACGIETRWPGDVTLGPLLQTSGTLVPTPSGTLVPYGRFLDIPGAVLFAAPSGSWKCQVWRNANTTWERVDSLATNTTNADKGRDWCFPVPDATDDQSIYLGTGANLWRSGLAGTTFAAVESTAGAAIPARALGYDSAEETLFCQKTKDDAKLYSISGHPTATVTAEICKLGGLIGSIVSFYDADGKFVPYISVFKAPSGDNAGKPLASLYAVDLIEGKVYPVADAPPAVLAPASGEAWDNLCVWQGWIYMFQGHDLFRYRPGEWENVPPADRDFSLPWPLAGSSVIRGMAKDSRFLYLLVSILSNGAGAIVAVSPAGAWHIVGILSSGRQGGPLLISDAWTPRRLCWYSTLGAIDNPAMRFVELTDGADAPKETTGYPYVATDGGQYFRLPWFDGGFSHIDGVALRVRVMADDLTTTERIIVSYYLNGNTSAETTLGTINDTTSYLDFGSGAGVAFKTIRFQFLLHRGGTATTSPRIRRIVFEYLKKGPARWRYTATLAVKATKTGLRNIETVLTDLESAFNSTTLPQLKYGRVSTYVNLTGLSFIERAPPRAQGAAQRNVWQIQVVMEEPLS